MLLNRVKGFGSSLLKVIPYGVGLDDQTFDFRVIAWNEVSGLYIPTTLTQASATLSTAVGVAGAVVTNSERFADTIVASLGNAGVDVNVISPANNTPAHLVIDLKGCELVEIIFDMTSATSGNALVKGF